MSAVPALVLGIFPDGRVLRQRSRRNGGCFVFCALHARLLYDGVDVATRPRIARGLAAVIAAGGGFVAYDDLFEAVWGHDPDGGPLLARQSVTVLLCYMRKALAPLGLNITTVHGRGLMLDLAQHRAAA